LTIIQELPGYRPGNNELFVLVKEDVADTVREVHGERIKQSSEPGLLDSLVDFSDYFDESRARVSLDKLPDSELSLCHTYVRSHLLDEDPKPFGQDLEEFLRDWMQESRQRQIAVFGEYGQGKSTGSWMFAYHLVQDHNERHRASRW